MLNHRLHRRRGQSGVMLLEVLIALLIFSLGVLGLVGLQASAVKQSGQARYRTDATLLANELIGQMWITDRSYGTLSTRFTSASGGGMDYNAWKVKVAATLPGASTYPPQVTVTEIPPLFAIVAGASGPPTPGLTSTTRVTITMRWKAPGEDAAAAPHSFVVANEIKCAPSATC